MPTALRRILFPQRLLPPIRDLARRTLETPFGRLVRHFLVRLVRGGLDAASTEVELGVGALLGLLAMPGAFTCFIVIDKYSSFLSWYRGRFHQDYLLVSLPDKYLFLALAMTVTGIVTVLKWDKILPDPQDYLNLAPLPIRSRTVLLANATAIAVAVLVFAVDVNAVPVVFFPFFVTGAAQTGVGWFVQFAATHAACVMLATIFTFCAVFALLGTLSALLPREAFRACSSWVRAVFLVAFLMLLVSGFTGPQAFLRQLQAHPDSPVRFLPSLWFLGLYQSLQQRATPALAELARMCLPGGGLAFGLMVGSYALGYRRRFAAVLEGGRRPSDQRVFALLLRFLDLFSARASGFERACHRFTVRALLRNEAHRVSLAVALGLGWLAAYQNGALRAPFATAYLLVLGLRVGFELPAGAAAAWIFRATLDPRENETLPAARRVIVSFLTLFVLLPAFALAWWKAGLPTATQHVLYLLALTVCLIEIQFAGYRKIPLTCPMPGFRDSLLVICLVQFLGYEAFTRAGASVEEWMLKAPVRLLLVPAVMAGAWYWNRQRIKEAREAGELEEGLTFENIRIPVVERLDL